MQGLAVSVLCVGIVLLVAAHPAAPQSDAPHLRAAETICTAPPFDARARSLVRRLPGYDRILDTIVDRCPDVAMIFAEFSVGAVPQDRQRPVLDYLWLLDFPTHHLQAQND